MSEDLIRALPVWKGPIEVEPLGGGLTNLNYLVTEAGRRFAVRAGVDDPVLGISRRNEAACVHAAADLGIAPEVVYQSQGVMVCEFLDATPLSPELLADHDRIRRVAELLRRVHSAGPEVSGHLQYFSPFQVARTYMSTARDAGLPLPCDEAALAAEVADLERRISPFQPTFCHNDLMPANLLDAGDRVWLIDWEYAGIGHRLFDLAGLSSNGEFSPEQDASLLAGYGLDGDGDAAAQFRVMRAMAPLREWLWAVIQRDQAKIDFDYDQYRDDNYRRYRAALASV